MSVFHNKVEQPRHSKRCKFLAAALKDAFSLLRLLQDSNVSIFHHDDQSRYSKRCKFVAAAFKDAFFNCHTFNGRLSTSGPEEDLDCPTSDFDDEQEVVVSEIRSRAMEKMKRRPFLVADSLCWVFSPSTGYIINSKQAQRREKDEEEENDDERPEEYFSVGSCFSLCSSAVSREAFLSVKTNFSRCSSLARVHESEDFWKLDIQDFRRRSIIQEFCFCEGWPFGLCRKAVLLPPLPKSPSDSWSWRKGTPIAKTLHT